jgi:hypothetical protein
MGLVPETPLAVTLMVTTPGLMAVMRPKFADGGDHPSRVKLRRTYRQKPFNQCIAPKGSQRLGTSLT